MDKIRSVREKRGVKNDLRANWKDEDAISCTGKTGGAALAGEAGGLSSTC